MSVIAPAASAAAAHVPPPPSPQPSSNGHAPSIVPVTGKPAKVPFLVTDLIIGAMIGTLFCTVSLFDFSISLYAKKHNNYTLASHYCGWKQEQPVLSWVIFPLVLALPLALLDNVNQGLIGLWTKRASRVRHVLDVTGLWLLIGVLTLVFTQVIPREMKMAALRDDSNTVSLSEQAILLAELTTAHASVFFINTAMLILPFLRYNESKRNATPLVAAITNEKKSS